MSKMRKMNETETFQFAKIYLSHECLWNHDHPDYKMKSARQDAHRDFIAELQDTTGILLNESELRLKIKNLRSTYIQELAKIRQRSSPNSTYRPSIKWFAEWHKCFKNQARLRIDDIFEEPEPEDEKIWVEQLEDHSEDINRDPFVTQNDDDYVLILKSEPEDTLLARERPQSPYKIKKKKIKYRSPSTDNSERTYRSSIDSSLSFNNSIKEDEFDIYGKYIASQLRKMDLQKALRVQLEIQGIVSEARISEMTNK